MNIFKCQKCGKMWDEQGVPVHPGFSQVGTRDFPLVIVPRCNPCQQEDITAQPTPPTPEPQSCNPPCPSEPGRGRKGE